MKTHTLLQLFLLAVLILPAQACINEPFNGLSDDLVTQTRDVSGFHELEINGGYKVTIVPGETDELQITAPDQYIDDVISEVTQGRLTIRTREGVEIRNSEGFEIALTFAHLDYLEINGAAELKCPVKLATNSMDVVINGAADITLDVDLQRMQMEVNGAADLSLKGKATEANFMLAGASNLDAEDLETRKMKIDMSGAGNAEVFVTNFLDATVSGVGNIRYKGDPQVRKNDQSVFGTIKPM